MRTIAAIAAIGLSGVVGAQELWHTGAPADMYGIYFMVPIRGTTQGGRGVEIIQNGQRAGFNAPNMNVEHKQESLVGRIEAKVKDVVYKDMACKQYTSVYYVQAPQNTNLQSLRRETETWVDFAGVTRRVRTTYRDMRKTVEIDALFEKDTIEMDITENGKKRHLSMNPVQGLAAFNSPIPDMIKNATKDRYEKSWCTIDPTNGGILEYKIRLKGRFVPPTGSSSTIKGWTFEVKAPVGIHTMHVGEDGQLRQIDFADTSVVRAVFNRPIGGG